MERLTTNKSVEEMNMTELARNSCYAKDGYAWYRDFETDIDARELARDLMLNWGLFELDSDEMLSDEIFDETMMDNLQYGSKEIEGLIALFYRNIWAMADLHSRLKAYEDAEEQGLILRLPCEVGDTIYEIGYDYKGRKYINEIEVVIISANYGDLDWDKNEHKIRSAYVVGSLKGTNIGADVGFCDFGRTVFLTKEEAEQAIARMEGKDG